MDITRVKEVDDNHVQHKPISFRNKSQSKIWANYFCLIDYYSLRKGQGFLIIKGPNVIGLLSKFDSILTFLGYV